MKNTNNTTHTKEQSKTQSAKKAKQIKLGLDISAKRIVVVRQIDGATPQPAQSFGWEEFELWAKRQVTQAEEVFSCYEAGPFGYKLHRTLTALGIKNVVVRPVTLDPEHRRVKTDKTDAQELCAKLDRYLNGNRKAFSVITIPSQEQELARSESRLRDQIQKDRKVWELRGRSLLLYYGIQVRGKWWRAKAWERVQEQLCPQLANIVGVIQQKVVELSELEAAHTQALLEEAPTVPIGVGSYTQEVLNREMLDWQGFKNRRQVGSITGLCPGVSASGDSRRDRCITRRGRKRVRAALIELAWRLTYFQPHYPPVVQFHQRCKQTQSRAVRKKAIVALARRIAIDLWRMATGRASAQELKLQMPD